MSSLKPWADMVEPIVRKCRLAVSLDLNTSFNPDGSVALADLLSKMAEHLDSEIKTVEADRDRYREALIFIAEGYDNHDVNHVDFRVKAYQVAIDALQPS